MGPFSPASVQGVFSAAHSGDQLRAGNPTGGAGVPRAQTEIGQGRQE
jgi:hypothetical protein